MKSFGLVGAGIFYAVVGVLFAPLPAHARNTHVCSDQLRFEIDDGDPFDDSQVIELTDSDGVVLGRLEYSVEGSTAFPSTNVNEAYQRRGFNRRLANFMIRIQPRTKHIVANLTEVNYGEFKRALSDTKNEIKALKETPFWKVYSKLGFDQIQVLRDTGKHLEVKLGRALR